MPYSLIPSKRAAKPPKRAAKRNRDPSGSLTASKTHSVAKATVRDAIVVFGAGYGALPIPVERRIAQYLTQERVLAVGGEDGARNSIRSCHSFDTEAGAWVAEALMLEGRDRHGLAVLHGELWALGGWGPWTREFWDVGGFALHSCERLDQATNAWVRGPNMLTKRACFGVAILNGEIWAVGGAADGEHKLHHVNKSCASCERLDAATGTWVPGPDMLLARSNHCVAVFRGELWAVGGYLDSGAVAKSCERLDMASNQWVMGPAMTFGRRSFGLAVFRGQLWAVGATRRGLTSGLAVCECLDVATNTWMAGPPLITLRYIHGLAVLNGYLWALGDSASGDRFTGHYQRIPRPFIEHVGRGRTTQDSRRAKA